MKIILQLLIELLVGLNNTIYFQPIDFTQEEVYKVQEDFCKNFDKVSEFDIKFLPNISLSDSTLNSTRTRYRGEKMLRQLPKRKDGVTIYLTHKDISTTAHGIDDFGILGISSLGGHSCVISDYRVKDKSQLWKVVLHEFIHARYNAPHCANDDPQCIMRSGHGKENLPRKKYLCKDCKSLIN